MSNNYTERSMPARRRMAGILTRHSACSASGEKRHGEARMQRIVREVTATLLLLCGVIPAAPAGASVVPRVATLETNNFSEFDATNAVEGILTVSTELAYEGTHSAKATYNGGPNNGFERGIYYVDWPDETDVWYGAAFYFPPGFY